MTATVPPELMQRCDAAYRRAEGKHALRRGLLAAVEMAVTAERDRIKGDAADLGQGQLRSQAWWFRIIDGGAP